MRVIGAGWGRTGTTSLAAALCRLGVGPCLQMNEMWSLPELVDVWNADHAGATTDWRTVLHAWNSTVDWPGCWQWQEFANLWPDALIVLSVRDPNDWYDSVRQSIHAWTVPGTDMGSQGITSMMARLWNEDFGGWERALDRDHAIGCFERHNQSVRDACPPERLVEWTTADGWSPLAMALRVDAPEEPFPHLNAR